MCYSSSIITAPLNDRGVHYVWSFVGKIQGPRGLLLECSNTYSKTCVLELDANQEITVTLYENPTVVTKGTEQQLIRRLRHYQSSPTSKLYLNPTMSNKGTYLEATGGPAGTYWHADLGFFLCPNCSYYIEVEPNTAQLIWVHFCLNLHEDLLITK